MSIEVRETTSLAKDFGVALHADVMNTASMLIDGSNRCSDVTSQTDKDLHIIQTSTSLQPIYNATGFNGKPGLNFASKYMYLDDQALNLQGDLTILFVGSYLTGSQAALSFRGDAEDIEAKNTIYNMLFNSSNQMQTQHEYGGGINQYWESLYVPNVSDNCILGIVRDATAKTWDFLIKDSTQDIKKNSVADGGGAIAYTQNPTGGSLAKLYVGSSYNGTNSFKGYMSELMIFPHKLNKKQIDITKNTLINKWGL